MVGKSMNDGDFIEDEYTAFSDSKKSNDDNDDDGNMYVKQLAKYFSVMADVLLKCRWTFIFSVKVYAKRKMVEFHWLMNDYLEFHKS